MSSIESQLSEYRARKARERKKEKNQPESQSSGLTSTTGHKSNAVNFPGLSSIMGVLDFFRRDPAPTAADQSSESLLPESSPSKLKRKQNKGKTSNEDHIFELPDDEDDKLISRNCIVACSPESSTKQKIIAALPVILKFTLWTVLWAFFIEIGFGAVYFVISLLIIMYFSLRTRPKKDGEMSAYSVFNPGQEKIDGTFSAEDFERQLRYGAGILH